MFVTYVFWDFWTKRKDRAKLLERGWASAVCALLAVAAFFALRDLRGTASAALADLCLLALVLLFRAMKLQDFSKHTRFSQKWIGALVILFVILMVAALNAEKILAIGLRTLSGA